MAQPPSNTPTIFDIKSLMSTSNVEPFSIGTHHFLRTPTGIVRVISDRSIEMVSAAELMQIIQQEQARLSQLVAASASLGGGIPGSSRDLPQSSSALASMLTSALPPLPAQPNIIQMMEQQMLRNKQNMMQQPTSNSNSTLSVPNNSFLSQNYEQMLMQQREKQAKINNKQFVQQLKQQFDYTTNRKEFDKMFGQLTPEELAKLDDEEDDDEDIFESETYADYMPSKLKIGVKHPDHVVETSSLSSVKPPDVWYKLSIPNSTINAGKLSALQLESITYASQQHNIILPNGHRAGFLIGDGAGVGKGRTVAGIIFENHLKGRKKAIWLSVSTDLKYDAERDLEDIGAKIKVYPLNKFKYANIASQENGRVTQGIIFATYSSLISESSTSKTRMRTRLHQLLQWCGKDFDGVIIFDECHKAKNLMPSGNSGYSTKTAKTVLDLQNSLPKARIVYASATGATEPRNMAYMVRLGLWGQGTSFVDFNSFISTVEKRGVGAMELVAIDMKLRGMYIARQLSFNGVNFEIKEIPLHQSFIDVYNDCVDLWLDAKVKFERALQLSSDDQSRKRVWTQFWASHQRFFKYLCIAAKVPIAIKLCRESLAENKTVVIGLQSTGEARTLEHLEENGGELTDFVSTAKAVFQSLIEKHFPAPKRKTLTSLGIGKANIVDESETNGSIRSCRRARQETQKRLQQANKSKLTRKPARNGRARAMKKPIEIDLEDEEMTDVESQDDYHPKNGVCSDDDEFPQASDESSEMDSELDRDSGSDFTLSQSDSDEEDEASGNEAELNPSDDSDNYETDDSLDEDDNYDDSVKKRKGKFAGGSSAKKAKAIVMTPEARSECEKMRNELLNRLNEIGDRLPANTIDDLIDKLGGSDVVAEMTGRKGRVVSINGQVTYESRAETDVSLEMLNMAEKDRFMNNEKHVAIISEAASSGISLHADRRVPNQKRRVHITIELPWSADRAVQQFGRTHRSNQVSAPEYLFLISDLAGEQRFASIVAKRLESLGALTHGDRRATKTRDLSRFNVDNKYGRNALEHVIKSIAGIDIPTIKPPESYAGDFFEDARIALEGVDLLEKDVPPMNRFLNRLLGCRVEIQNAVFQYFSDTLEAVIKRAKRLGRYDQGIMDLTSEIGKVERVDHRLFYTKHSTGLTQIELHRVAVDRGLSWDGAKEVYDRKTLDVEGFYTTKNDAMIRKGLFLAMADHNLNKKADVKDMFLSYKPNSGLQTKSETLASIRDRGRKISVTEAEQLWKTFYEFSERKCGHLYWYGTCRRVAAKLDCDFGLRKRFYHILSGSVLTVWSHIESVVPQLHSKLQIARLSIAQEDIRVIGTLIHSHSVHKLVAMLEEEEQKHKDNLVERQVDNKPPESEDEEDTEIEDISDD